MHQMKSGPLSCRFGRMLVRLIVGSIIGMGTASNLSMASASEIEVIQNGEPSYLLIEDSQMVYKDSLGKFSISFTACARKKTRQMIRELETERTALEAAAAVSVISKSKLSGVRLDGELKNVTPRQMKFWSRVKTLVFFEKAKLNDFCPKQ
ncbi:MAG: hypothetical protein H7222_16495 [Methylotenera sp.]|nr:hypothetical protein [Oligoflexia bacterium]